MKAKISLPYASLIDRVLQSEKEWQCNIVSYCDIVGHTNYSSRMET